MKILVAGSRGIKSFDLKKHIPNDTELIISGGAAGVDSLAEKYADEHRISKLILRPDYAKYGKAAPIIRNRKMVDLADEIIIIWDGKSRGTKQTLDYAKKQAKPLKLITLTENKDEKIHCI